MLRSLFSYVAAGLGLAFSTVSAAEPEAPYEWALVGTPDRRFLGFDVGSLVTPLR
jgi:hypothetical protein